MTKIEKWNAGSVTTIFSTELNSLGNGIRTVASSIINNDTALDVYIDIELNLASFTPSPTNLGARFGVYIAESIDGTNYPNQDTGDFRLTNTQILAFLLIGNTAATAQRVVARNVIIPPAKFKVFMDNQTGGALAASGNTLKFLTYDLNVNG
jgi:hypothetical protein